MTITKADFANAARWVRDHLPAFTVSTVTFAALWVAVGLACITLYIWDASFYRSLAPAGMEWTFQSAGVVFRTFVIFGGLAIVWIKQNSPRRQYVPAKLFGVVPYQKPLEANTWGKAAQTLRFLWVLGLVACGVAAMGFVTEGNDYHYRRSAAVTQTATASTESADARLKRIDAERAATRADRDKLVSGARASMDLVLDDGNSGNDDVSTYEENIAKYEAAAAEKLARLDAQADAIERERLAATKTATQESVGDPGLPAVFRYPARYLAGFDGITFRDLFALFWVILLEACGSVGAQSLLAVQMAMAKRKAAQAAGSQGGKTTARRNRVRGKQRLIEHYHAERRRDEFDEDAGDTVQTAEDISAAADETTSPEDDDLSEDDDGDGDSARPKAAE